MYFYALIAGFIGAALFYGFMFLFNTPKRRQKVEERRTADLMRSWEYELRWRERDRTERRLNQLGEDIEKLYASAIDLIQTHEGGRIKIDETPDEEDPVNHPSHYTAYKGIEVIQLTEQMNFNRGNAVKYIARAGLKSKAAEREDLEKACWYLNREISSLRGVVTEKEWEDEWDDD